MAPPGKNVVNRQSKSFKTVLPVSQIPSNCEGGTSVAVTVTVKLVFTFGIVTCNACALGSVHGFAGVGLGFDGQLNVAICAESFPAGNVKFTDTGAAAKFAVTDSAALIVTVHVGEVVELAQA